VLEEEHEDRARQQELFEKVRTIRALSRDFARVTDRDETTSRFSESQKTRTSHHTSVCEWEKENQRKI
jgi:hypothetical protein